MNLLRKFYDAAVAEQVSAEPINIAEAMAKSGHIVEAGQPVSKPNVEIKEEKPETKTTEEKPITATVVEETKVEEVKGTKPPKEESKVEEKVVDAKEEAKPLPTWQEVLKQQQPEAVLKELGFDEKRMELLKELDPKMVEFLSTWKSGGDVTAYLKEATTDYTKMSAENVMRHNLRLEYPSASDKAIEALFKKEVIEAFQLDAEKYSEEEVEEGKLLLDAKADKLRGKLIENQKNYLFPAPPEAKAPEPDTSDQESTAKFEAYKAQVSNNPYIKEVYKDNKLSLGEGDEKFTFPVTPSEVTDILFDSEKWASTMFEPGLNEKGDKVMNPKVEHQMLVATVAKYGKNFLNAYAEHFKTIGGKKAIEPIDNAKPIQDNKASKVDAAPTSAAEAMAKSGKLVS